MLWSTGCKQAAGVQYTLKSRTSVRFFNADLIHEGNALEAVFLAYAGRLDQAEVICNQQQHEKRDGKPYTQSQCLDGTIGFAFILHHENKRGSEAGDNEYERKGNKNFHGEYGATGRSGSANSC
jgi:hypothetical protein